MRKPVFEIDFECTNCGKKWKEQFAKGESVDYWLLLGSEIWVRCKGSYDRTIVCSCCGRKKGIHIGERTPIEEAKDV